MSKKDILVVGPGYVGGPLATLLTQNYLVSCLNRAGGADKNIKWISYDFLGRDDLVLPEFHRIFFLPAAKSRETHIYRDVYLNGLKKVLGSQASPDSKCIFVSSTSVYGENAGTWVKEEDAQLSDPRLGERQRILLEAEAFALKHNSMVVRFGGIYGPGRTSMIKRLTQTPMESVQPSYTNRIHKDDCVRLLAFLNEKGSWGEAYNGVDDDPACKTLIAAWVHKTLGISAQDLPRSSFKPSDNLNKRISNQRIKNLGFRFTYPSFREGYSNLINSSEI